MKKTLCLLSAALLLTGCNLFQNRLEFKTNKDYVSWENGNLQFYTYRYSEDVKFNLPAFEVFLKYQDGRNIHMPIDGYALGYGASCPLGGLGFYKPKNLEMAEVLMQTDEKLVVHLRYEPWTIYDEQITLDKQITIYKDSPILSVIDYYTGLFELLNIAAGMTTAFAGTVTEIENGYTIDYPYGVASIIVMPDAEEKYVDETFGTTLLKKGVTSNEALHYYIGLSDKGEAYLLEELDKIL